MDTLRAGRSPEAAEAQINAFIERRAQKGETDPDEREDLWVASVARFNEARTRQIRAQWYGWHCDQAERHRRTLAALIAHHEGEAEKLLEPQVPDDAA